MRTRAKRMTLGAVLALALLAGVAGVLGAASHHGRLRSDIIGPHSPTTYLNQAPYSPTMYCVRLLADGWPHKLADWVDNNDNTPMRDIGSRLRSLAVS